jgi:rod shape-determining protein MreD
MILSVGAVLRGAILVLVSVVAQVAVVSQFTFWGANADLTPLIPLAVGLLGGPVAGSLVGFSTGLVMDMSLVQTLGVSSLLLTGVGYLAGRYRELRDASHTLLPVVAAAVATLAYATSFSITQFLLGVDSQVSGLVVRDILIGVVVNSIVAIPLFGAVRSILRPSLVDSHRPRRRSPQLGLRIPAS